MSTTDKGLICGTPSGQKFCEIPSIDGCVLVSSKNNSDGTEWKDITTAYGGICSSAQKTITVSASDTEYEVDNVCSLMMVNNEFSNTTTYRLQYDGAVTKKFIISAHFSSSCEANDKQIILSIGKNGTALGGGSITQNKKIATDSGSTATLCTLSTGDYISLFINNKTDTSDVIVSSLTIVASQIAL